MTTEENKRIATLTTGAINTTMESAVEAMLKAVEAAEEKTKEMREATEQYIADFKKVTSELASTVNSHVLSCQAAIDSIQEHHLKIINGEAQVPAPEPTPAPMPRMKPAAVPIDLDNELGKLATLSSEGRR